MPYQICWKCKRSVGPLTRREKDRATKKTWLITYCPFERCAANLDLIVAPKIKLWDGNFFRDEDEPEDPA